MQFHKLRSNHTPKSKWTQEEDYLLVQAVKKIGELKWNQISKFVGTRSGKQCRERQFTNLNPDINNEPWTPEEDEKLLRLHNNYGNKWSELAKNFNGRTVLNVKNRWRTFIRRGIIPKVPEPKTEEISAKEFEDFTSHLEAFNEFEQVGLQLSDFASYLFE